MTAWEATRWLHLLAMAFFVGGQLFLAACVLLVMRDDRPRLQAVARRFGWGTLGALAVLVGARWMEGLVFVLSLAIVWLGVALAH